ncbi:MAG: Stp1/IreP family PP2C-type Ser/Thr phosphatase [Lachnospiraceae bacterium]
MKSYGKTHVGMQRSINQDYIYYTDNTVGNLKNLYIVADGMGGHRAGDKASSFAVNRFVELVKENENEDSFFIMKEVIKQVNKELIELAASEEEFHGMGTTFVAATVDEEEVSVVNIGDSRLYLYSENLRQITLDHSLVEELLRAGQIEKSRAKNHPQKNIITKALGASLSMEPDFFKVEWKIGDKVLLCSDGLSNMVDDDEIEEILAVNSEEEKIVTQLVDQANYYGGLDNIATVIIINDLMGERGER